MEGAHLAGDLRAGEIGKALGLGGSTATSYLNTSKTLGELLGETGDKLTMTINGKEFSFAADTTLESVLTQYQQTVKPMHERYVEPSKQFAHIVVPEGGKNLVALDMITGRIQRHLEETCHTKV